MKPGRGEKGFNLAADNTIFAQLLRQAGYATAICGKWQLRGTMAEHGFDEHCMWQKYEGFNGPVETEKLRGKRGIYLGRAARYWHPAIVKNDTPVPTTDKDYGPDIFLDFILDFARRNRDRPFLVYYPMCLPHRSWDFEAGRSGYLPVPELDKDGTKTGRKIAGSLKSNVEYIDTLIGRMVKGLEALGLRDDTVILFTGDNGTAGYGKAKVTRECGPRVPMIVNAPGLVKARGAVDDLADFSDVLPTLCDLAGATLPKGYVVDGQSFAPMLRGNQHKGREWIFSNYADRRMIRDGRWLLDGDGRLYDCGRRRDETGYKNVTTSDAPDAAAARSRLHKILERLPGPTPAQMKHWPKNKRSSKGRRRKRKAE
jgi:arylsulfatase A